MGKLDGRAVVVTGSGRGLGRSYAMAAAAEGAAVMVNDIDGEEAEAAAAWIRDAGYTAAATDHSVADYDQATALMATCVERFGRIDGVVSNAGLFLGGPPWELEPDSIRRLVDVNVIGVIFSGLAAIEHFRRQRSGVIINVSSGSALGMSNMSLYGTTKGAVATLTYSWALDLAAEGIRVIGYSPLARTRMGGMAAGPDPDRVAVAIPYLLSPESVGLSGQIVRFDGTNLSLLRLPKFLGPFVTHDSWTVDAVGDAFRETLRPTIEMTGFPGTDLSARP